MIAHLRGTVAGVAPDGAIIEVGGVGMRVQCTPGTLATLRPGESAQVATSLVVREDSLTLFGFASDDERNVFELLQTASGVGPRLALAMLAASTAATLAQLRPWPTDPPPQAPRQPPTRHLRYRCPETRAERYQRRRVRSRAESPEQRP